MSFLITSLNEYRVLDCLASSGTCKLFQRCRVDGK